MKPSELRSRLTGVIAFPTTPFNDDLSLDIDGLRQNLEYLLQYPICAVVAAGGTGELYSLTPEEHRQVIQTTVSVVGDAVPVIAGVGFNQSLATAMAHDSERLGADGILVFPPYYPQADDEGMFEYYASVADATQLGIFIYSRDWANFYPQMVERLAHLETLIAWKDGQGDIRRLQSIMRQVGDRLHWIGGAGDDMVPAYYSIGIRTYTSSIAGVAPRLSLKLHELAAAGDAEELTVLMKRCVIPLYAIRGRRKGYEVSTMKALMDLAGLKGGVVRPPLVNVRTEELPELSAILEEWKAFM